MSARETDGYRRYRAPTHADRWRNTATATTQGAADGPGHEG
jgi:hypothetical protein